MSRRGTITPTIEPSAIVSISAQCYCGASSVLLPVRASHAEESAAIRAAVAACAVCGAVASLVLHDHAAEPDAAVCPTCGRPL